MNKRIVVHGHFYQPPREDPWTDEIPHQPGAAPFHNWNERIHAESYRANAFVVLETEAGEKVVNNYERISFNIGPTLMRWLEDAHPRTYERILAADVAAIERLGHGNAMAQAYHHTILPLSSERDIRTEVRWGLADFRHRFGRAADGMWLPEAAVSDTALSVLIDEGVAFTVLAPYQAERWRPLGGDARWNDVRESGIDTRYPYRYHHPDGSGRALTLFFYDAGIARAIAFQNAMASAEHFLEMFTAGADASEQLINAATDGETYGHHHKFGDIGLAYALFVEAPSRGVEPTNYAAHLAEHAPRAEVRVAGGAGTSWSCAHGVERWRSDCGCSTRGRPGWNQRWREPLRDALDLVHDAACRSFGSLGADVFSDPWAARDAYVDVVIGARAFDDFMAEHARPTPEGSDDALARSLLEMQRHSLSMFTSCAWFFADVGDIETIQILRYAARTLELIEGLGEPAPTERFVATLAEATSNDPAVGTGADVYRSEAARRGDPPAWPLAGGWK